eukprot:CAMPEP_0169339780 /NCGR_PEP_ID=MMETSP1017-20121227/18616_1 /TAXON_ID=342587 /ORGANISM="Karlodinium micrum, Strain CCMP2283" /LENGTH=126 /DNA_ID=CAMNT_0009435373 /DNA_START=336 /DNA_END=717 /DNA_ORIENTATION=+
MDLPSLASGNLQSTICIFAADVIHGKPLLSSAKTSGHAHADHEAESLLYAQFLSFISKIAVILLIVPVKFHYLVSWYGTCPVVTSSKDVFKVPRNWFVSHLMTSSDFIGPSSPPAATTCLSTPSRE